MSKEYIFPYVVGRLGNNLSIIAYAYIKSKELGKELILLRKSVQYQGNDYSKNIFRNLKFVDTFSDAKNSVRYRGWYQGERYIKGYEEEIKDLFGPPKGFPEKIQKKFGIFDKRVTAINVRRGKDYLSKSNYHPVVTIEYIKKALSLIKNTEHYLVASDDMKWCKENIKLPNCIYLEGYPPEEQLWILSLCTNFVISNSSFSWWAAYLSRKNGKVIAPETWFGPSRNPTTWADRYCEGWTILPTYFKDGKIYPK